MSPTLTTTANAACPVCDAAVPVPAGTLAHEVLVCGDCQSELEVTSVDPLVVEQAPEVEEDWGE